MSYKNKYSFLEDHQDAIILTYDEGNFSIVKLAKKYGVTFNAMRYRLKLWGVYKPTRRYRRVQEFLEDSEQEIIRDRESGMTLRYLEIKWGISHASIMTCSSHIKGKIPRRKPDPEELDKLLEDLNSELFFLGELSHCYILPEKTILEIAYQHKCIVHFDYDKMIDFLMYDSDLTLNQILKEVRDEIVD